MGLFPDSPLIVNLSRQIRAGRGWLAGKWGEGKRAFPRLFLMGRLMSWGIVVALGLLLAFYLSVRWGAFGQLPSTEELQQIENALASEVYTADGQLMGRYFIENRTQITYDQLSPELVKALVATEDARFFEHDGVDNRSMARVLVKSILMGDQRAGGGSTLTQQLVKNLYPRRNYGRLSMPVNKVKEMIVAGKLEEIYAKEQLLSLYLNTVPFGEEVFGIETASKRFFGKTPADLKVEESAMLVGMLKATHRYNPRLFPERATARRNLVLQLMAQQGHLSQSTTDSLQSLPVSLTYKRYTPNEGLGPYFRAHLQTELKAWLKANPGEDGKPYNLFRDGLKIYTTIDSRMQGYAEAAVKAHMAELQQQFYQHWKKRSPWGNDQSVVERAVNRSRRYRSLKAKNSSRASIDSVFALPVPMRIFTWEGEVDTVLSPLDSVIHYLYFLNAGFMAMDPKTGSVHAWVGGINHHFFQYDHVKAKRQVGSTFKPVVYAAALEAGRDPCSYIANEQLIYEDYHDWSPANADGKYGGYYSMQGALTHSVNTVSVSLIMETGVDKVVELGKKLGIKNELPAQPAIALGAADLSLYEMLSVYGTFANAGKPIAPQYLIRIEDKTGKVIYNRPPPPITEPVLNDTTVKLITHMLRAVADSGTASSLRYRYKLKGQIAGKTGTTQDQADGWFMGYRPGLVAGAWVGAADPKIHFRSLRLGQGAKTALPIWANFMKAVASDDAFDSLSNQRFLPLDEGFVDILDCPTFQHEVYDDLPFWIHWIERLPISIKPSISPEERQRRKEARRQQKELNRQHRKNEKFIKELERRLKKKN